MSQIDYRHHFHAANIGDVWKHCALIETLRVMAKDGGDLRVIETHAGAGVYKLGGSGEWTAGLGALESIEQGAAGRYLEQARALGVWKDGRPRVYPGSPVFALPWLGAGGRVECYELVAEVAAALERRMSRDDRARVHVGDGLASLGAALEEGGAEGGATLVHIDPPYSDRREWVDAARAIIDAVARAPDARIMLWYPIKSLTRPNTLIKTLRDAGVSGTVAELVTTPLELKRKRLSGSGVLWVRPPAGVVSEVCAAAPALGACCATDDGRWSLRCQSWG